MHAAVPLACFLSMIRPPGVQYENALLQIAPVDKSKCPYVKDNNDVGFQLFTRHNPTAFQELTLGDDEKLFASNMDFNDKTVVYFHAWMEQPDDGSGIMVREAYMQRGDTNVIMVDAHHLEAGPWYFTAAQNTWYIGRFAARFIDYLASRGLNLNNTHLIGHSLGAHAAGVAGSSLKAGRVSRITGLDPALPLFEGLPLEQRLDTTDAAFVDIIHTDAGIFGYKAPMGHVDFYPNGGISPQPGCELEVVLPKQLLLNKCDQRKQTQGFYSYYLTANRDSRLKRKSLESKLENLFAFIQSVKAKNDDGDKENSTKTDKLDTELRQEDKNTNITQNDSFNKTSEVVKAAKQFENKSEEITNDSIKDVLIKGDLDKTEDYVEDQIAEASEYDKTQVEYNLDDLKAKETVSLIKYSEQFVLKDNKMTNKKILPHDNKVKEILSNNDKNFNISKGISSELQTGQKNKTEPIQDKRTGPVRDALKSKEYKTTEKQETTLTILDADFASFEETDHTIQKLGSKQTDKRESGVTILNYKDPCEPNKVANEVTTENTQTSYEITLPDEVIKPKDDKVAKPKQINIFNILGTTYRISQVISTLKQNKKSVKDKIKKLFRNEKTETTTPTFISHLFLEKDSRTTNNRVIKRQKRFLPFFRRSEEAENNNILFKMLDFLIKHRKNVLPVFTVMREINTLVKSGNGELNHISKEQNNYIGATPPVFAPITYNLELGNENRAVAFMKRILGLRPNGDRLTINGRK